MAKNPIQEFIVPVCNGKSPYIYICCKPSELTFVMPVTRELYNRGYDVCYGAKKGKAAKLIKRAAVAVAFITPGNGSAECKQFERDIAAAAAAGVPIIPVNMDIIGFTLPAALNNITNHTVIDGMVGVSACADAIVGSPDFVCSPVRAALDGDAAAAYRQKLAELGNRLWQEGMNAEYIKKNFSRAYYFYDLSAQLGDDDGLCCLALCYEHGNGVALDYKKAITVHALACAAGSAPAMMNLGNCYSWGRGVPQSPETAMRYYEKAANMNYGEAQNNLAICYLKGEGTEKNEEQAFYWFRLAADIHNVPEAQYTLAVAYSGGKDLLPQDHEKAIYYYTLAADQGHSGAQSDLGYSYFTGNGTAVDYEKAFHYFSLAAAQNDPLGLGNLATCYRYGKGTRKNLKKAVKYYKLAAALGNPESQYILANSYSDGNEMLRKKPKMAIYYYALAADQGHAKAQGNLGHCYFTGSGVAVDYEKAFHYFSLAAAQNDPVGLNNLATCYWYGKGTPKNPAMAVEYYNRAAALGSSEAVAMLEKLRARGEIK